MFMQAARCSFDHAALCLFLDSMTSVVYSRDAGFAIANALIIALSAANSDEIQFTSLNETYQSNTQSSKK